MEVDYNLLTDEAKVFVYPSSRKFYPQELDGLLQEIQGFLSENFKDYNFHFKILNNRFLVFFIEGDKTIPIQLLDKLADFILSLEQKYKVTLIDKINICFKQGDFIQYQDMKKFRTLLKNRSISENTVIFNNLVQNKYDFENNFETPLSESWLSHLVKKK